MRVRQGRFKVMSISNLNKLSPIHSEIIETINSFSLFGFDVAQGLTRVRVSFAEDLDSKFVDELFVALNKIVTNKNRGWTLELDILPVELGTLRISFSRIDPLGTFQVAFSQIFYDVTVESLVFNFNPRKLSQSPVLFNTKDGIVLADEEREATEEEVIAEIRKFISENFDGAARKS